MEKINASQMREMMEKQETPPVINVLDENAYREKHIPDTDNIPVSTDDFVERVDARVSNRSEPVVVYCASTDCDASEQAAERLEKAGFTNVIDYAAGTAGWEEAGYELARGR